jgi:hypothetical protein
VMMMMVSRCRRLSRHRVVDIRYGCLELGEWQCGLSFAIVSECEGLRTGRRVHSAVQQATRGLSSPPSQASPASRAPFPHTARAAPEENTAGGGATSEGLTVAEGVLEKESEEVSDWETATAGAVPDCEGDAGPDDVGAEDEVGAAAADDAPAAADEAPAAADDAAAAAEEGGALEGAATPPEEVAAAAAADEGGADDAGAAPAAEEVAGAAAPALEVAGAAPAAEEVAGAAPGADEVGAAAGADEVGAPGLDEVAPTGPDEVGAPGLEEVGAGGLEDVCESTFTESERRRIATTMNFMVMKIL